MLKYKIPQIVTLTLYKHIRKDGTKESFGFHKTKVSKGS